MYKTFLALVVLLCLVGTTFAQPTAIDARRYSTSATGWFAWDLTTLNSQYIYIRVTLAGARFALDNGDWVIGDNTVAPAWYCWPQNVYQSADPNNREGQFPPSWVAGTAPYTVGTTDDTPIAWNQGGVALDFLLAVTGAGGWNYEYKGETNRNWGLGLTSHDYFKNGFQVRAIFARGNTAGVTSHYDDAGWTQFDGTRDIEWTGPPVYVPAANEPRLQDCDIVYSTAMLTAAFPGAETATWNWAAGRPFPWAEATSARFNGNYTVNPGDRPYTSNAKGLGIPPDGRVTIAMQLLSPYKTTSDHAALLENQQVITLRLWGVASDAAD